MGWIAWILNNMLGSTTPSATVIHTVAVTGVFVGHVAISASRTTPAIGAVFVGHNSLAGEVQ